MKKLFKEILSTVALVVPSAIISGLILDITLGWEFASRNSNWEAMKRKIISITKSVKNKIW